jgi:hypothetical protein
VLFIGSDEAVGLSLKGAALVSESDPPNSDNIAANRALVGDPDNRLDPKDSNHAVTVRIELAETVEEFQFRRIVLQTPDGEEIESLTTLASSAYDHIDVRSTYTLRTVVEILCRELK